MIIVMGALPSGTVTFVFTDIEGSTRILREVGTSYVEILADHRRVLREVFDRNGGVEVDTQGDAFFYAFARATDAVSAAAETQAMLASGPVRVRMGVHTGEPVVADEGYVGLDVHIAARIAAAGHGGQVLLSQSTRDLVDVDVRELGMHRLKDLAGEMRLFQLGQKAFPPLRTLHRTNLPTAGTMFVGRDHELEQIATLLARGDVRLLTLTGPGGTGKTRLALQAAVEALERYPDGVFWVALAPLADPRTVLETVAAALEAEEELSRHIADRRMLLVLDNFERVIDAAGDISSLIDACPRLDVLVTSREPLHTSMERVISVAPLAEKDAVSVFMDRASAVRSGFASDGDVAAICRRLDCLPLAIELAAALVNVLSASAILERLERRLPVLTDGPRDAPERQQTLRATIDWSYDLLTPREQRMLARLAVFAGGCTLQSGEVVCGADLKVMASLVDKSLLRRRGERYWMLETIREYALERLHGQEEYDQVFRALGEYLADRGEEAERSSEATGSPRDPGALGRLVIELAEELGNVRAAVGWAFARPEPELALRLASEADWFAHGIGAFRAEQSRWLDEAFNLAGDAYPRARLRALQVAIDNAYHLGQTRRAHELSDEGVTLCRDLGDDPALIGMLIGLGSIAAAQGESALARTRYEQAIALAERVSDHHRVHDATHNLGELELRCGNVSRGADLLERSANQARNVGDNWSLPAIIHGRGDAALAAGDGARAAAFYREALQLSRELRKWQDAVYCVAGLAMVAATSGAPERAGKLWGAVDALEREVGWRIHDFDRRRYDSMIGVCSAANPIAFEAAAERGRRMAPDAIVDYALSEGRTRAEQRDSTRS